MGCYINPPDESKEEFLSRYGQRIDTPTWPPPEGFFHVCLVQNFLFSAAGVAYCEKEMETFRDDGRPHEWFLVPDEDLHKVSPLSKWLSFAERTA